MSLSIKRASLYLVLAILAIGHLVDAVPQRRRPSRRPKSRQSNGTTQPTFSPIVGCRGVADRRGVADLQNNDPDVFNMLLLAFQGVQKTSEDNDTSWYRIAGIHGYPFVPWQEDSTFVPANSNRGYCTHSSAIFSTWHRPYLVLLEQTLCEQARSVARQFRGRNGARYRAAAEKVRLPYWDWASSETRSRIPDAVKQARISVTAPSGRQTIANPLYSYVFLNPQPSSSGLGTQTVRSSSDDQLAASWESRRQSTLDLFTNGAYNQFSSNLENIHNSVHVQIGGNMVFVTRSAFDPIFFLHHCNIDRLAAMYQAARPGLTLTPQTRSPTYALGGSGPDDLSTPLYPFRHTDRNQWTSNDVASAGSIFAYGYSYPDVPQGLSTDELRAFTTQRVNALYAPTSSSASSKRDNLDTSRRATTATSATRIPLARLEWSANVQLLSTEMVGSLRINFFIGDEKSDANLAGVASIFANADMALSTPNAQINASVPLTPTLTNQKISLRPKAAVSALRKGLSWVVEQRTDSGTDFVVIETASLKSLVISVVSNEAIYPAKLSELPTKGEPVTYFEPTNGKVGGLQANKKPKIGSKVASIEQPAELNATAFRF